MAISATSAATLSSTSLAATKDVNSDKDGALEEEERGDLIDLSDNNDNSSNEEGDDVCATNLYDIFFRAARDIQNRTSRIIGTAEMEERRFHELFGARMEIVIHLWVWCKPGWDKNS